MPKYSTGSSTLTEPTADTPDESPSDHDSDSDPENTSSSLSPGDYTHQDENPTDANGNPLSIYRGHNFLSQYPQMIGVDGRGIVVYADGDNVQNALLKKDHHRSNAYTFDSLTERWMYGETPAEHVVNIASDYGPWKYVAPEIVEEIDTRDLDADIDCVSRDGIYLGTHVLRRWEERTDSSLSAPKAFEESESFEWPKAEAARFHQETGSCFVIKNDSVVTLYPSFNTIQNQDLRQAVIRNLTEEQLI